MTVLLTDHNGNSVAMATAVVEGEHHALSIATTAAGVETGTAAAPFRVDPTGSTTQPVSNAGTFAVQAAQAGSWSVTTDVDISGLALESGGNLAAIATAVNGVATAANQATVIATLEAIDAGKLEEATFTGRLGEVQAIPTANTVLARLKAIADALGVTITVAGTVTANLGTLNGAATEAKQDTIIGHIDGIESALADAVTSLQAIDDWDETNRCKVNLVVGQAGISAGAGAVAANSPRMTLASDDPAVALLTTMDADTGAMATDLAAIEVLLTTIAAAQLPDSHNVTVDGLPSLPAGTNNIGDVDVLSLPALPAGTNNIGDVDVLTLPAIPAGTNAIGRVGHDTTGLGHGAKTVTTAGTAEALAASTACKWVTIQANSDNAGVIAPGGSGVNAASAGVRLYADDSYSIPASDLADVFIDATVNGDGVCYTYGT